MAITTDWATYFWSLVGFMAFIRSLVPAEVKDVIFDWQRRFTERWSLRHRVEVKENAAGSVPNELYSCIHRYLGSLRETGESLTAECPRDGTHIVMGLSSNACLDDSFRGHQMSWEHRTERHNDRFNSVETRWYTLTVKKSDKQLVSDYLSLVLEKGRELERQDRQKQLFANMPDYWVPSPFVPPATFETVAMDPQVKKLLVDDLTTFMNGKEYYASVGRPWKRGYLLYGPPGTGKSSLIGAMANFTGYSVYDLELTKLSSNTELRQLLISVENRAIIVVEDIDCSASLINRADKKKKTKRKEEEESGWGITLSGLLNFTDGLWSACGSERIFVFTTNYVEKLDPALIRAGRMDMHISMSYCSFPMFKSLSATYLKICPEDNSSESFTTNGSGSLSSGSGSLSSGSGSLSSSSSGSSKEESEEEQHHPHGYFPQIETLLKEVDMTPADVVETLVRYKLDPSHALGKLVENLRQLKDRKVDVDDDDDETSSEQESEKNEPVSSGHRGRRGRRGRRFLRRGPM